MFKWPFGTLALAICLLQGSALAEETIRITSGEWAPYTSENLKHYGVVNRIVTEAFALQGIKVEYGFYPWSRAYDMVAKGEWDASSLFYYHKDREATCYRSDPVISTEEVFLHLKTFKFAWSDWSDLEGLTVGATQEYTHSRVLKDHQKEGGYYLEIVPSDEINIKKLLKGRIDVFPMEKDTFYYLMRTKFTPEELEKITFHPKPVINGDLYLLFSRKLEKSERLMKAFNRGLKKLKETGKYDQYFEESRRGEYLPDGE